MKNTKAQGGHIIAGASIVGGIVLAALTIAQGWSGFSTIFAAPPSEPSRNCNSSEPLPHVYDLNPRFGTEYPGANQWADNGTAVECQRTRKLLNRDELRLRPTVSTPKKSGSTFSDGRMPLFGRVFPDGLYYIAMGIGSPPRTYFLDIDTGSDLTWLSCDAPCVSCAQGPHPWYSPKTARLVDCQAELCAGVQIGKIQGCAAGGGGGARQCDYDVHYGDGSSSQGVLVADTLVFLHPDGKLVAAKVALGCAYDQEGGLKSSPSMTDGLLGLGSAAVSVPSQLAKQGVIANMIGHCLADSAAGGGYFFMGDKLVPSGLTWTPMLGKPASTYYYVGLQRIKVGNSWLNIDPVHFSHAHGGAIFDSGASFTYLTAHAYRAFSAAVTAGLKGSGLQYDPSDSTLPLCWRGPTAYKSVSEVAGMFGPVVFDFGGGSIFWGDSMLPQAPSNYLIVNAKGNVCLAVLDSGVVAPGGATTIIGDVSLKGYLTVYDNVNYRVGWAPSDCSQKP